MALQTSALPTQFQYYRRRWLFAVFAMAATAAAAFFLHPLALLLFTCLVCVVFATDDFKWLFLVAACAVFMTLSLSKQIDGDLVTYVTLQDYISQQPFSTLFHKDEMQTLSGTYRITELGFYGPFWVLSQLIPDARTALAFGASLAIYVPTFIALIAIGKSEKWSNGLILTVAIFTFFAGINFLQVTHLIRQYISAAFLFSAFALFLTGRNKWAVVVALFACTIHNGTAPLLFLLVVVGWMFRYDAVGKRGFFGITFRLFCSLILIVGGAVAILVMQSAFQKEDVPNIKIGHFIVVGSFFLIAWSAIKIQKLRSKAVHYATVIFLTIFVLSLGFYFLGLTTYALRYFIYLEWLYGLMVGAIMFTWFRSAPGLRVLARFAVSLAAAAILVTRIAVSEWMYGPGDNYLLTWDYFQVSQLVSR
jgi:hypothetical protein